MKHEDCGRAWELDAYREGRLGPQDALSLERHLRSCADCSERKADDERLRELARRLPDAPPVGLAVRRVKRRILNDAAMGLKPRGRPSVPARLTFACAATVVSLAVVWAVRHTVHPTASLSGQSALQAPSSSAPSQATLAGTVQGGPGSRWTQTREQDVERVALEDGSITVHVRPQRPNERFLVVLPDGEIEVRGTTFDVTVDGGKTTAVRVVEGVVELRIAGAPVRRLGAAEAWAAASSPAPPLPAAAIAPIALRREPKAAPVGAPSSQADAVDEETTEYSEALRALADGRNDDAAAALRAFVVAHPNASQAEDATFLEAVALARAGRVDAAGLAAEHHLARFPASFHRTEAAVLIDRAARLRDAGR